MICPHCNKLIKVGVTDEAMAEARKLRAKGYSLRDIQDVLRAKGHRVSFSSVSRKLKEKQ